MNFTINENSLKNVLLPLWEITSCNDDNDENERNLFDKLF